MADVMRPWEMVGLQISPAAIICKSLQVLHPRDQTADKGLVHALRVICTPRALQELRTCSCLDHGVI